MSTSDFIHVYPVLRTHAGAIRHTVNNKQLKTLARRASIRYDGVVKLADLSSSTQPKAAAANENASTTTVTTPAIDRHSKHKRLPAGSSPATLMTALERISIKRLSMPSVDEAQLPITSATAIATAAAAAATTLIPKHGNALSFSGNQAVGGIMYAGRRVARALERLRRRSDTITACSSSDNRGQQACIQQRQKLTVVLDLDEVSNVSNITTRNTCVAAAVWMDDARTANNMATIT
eukprot:8387-Heterococcus_DN1.PRE.1